MSQKKRDWVFAMLTLHTVGQAMGLGCAIVGFCPPGLRQHNDVLLQRAMRRRIQWENVAGGALSLRPPRVLWLVNDVQATRRYCDDKTTAADEVTVLQYSTVQGT